MDCQKIQTLSEDVRSMIRTGVALSSVGQTIEELLLNSIDANASNIAIRIDLSCFKIQVVDNGVGITTKQFELIGERYATSKCHSVEDLEQLKHFGYRGEALASIKNASFLLEIVSRPRGACVTLSKCFQRGKMSQMLELSRLRPSPGTTVTVHDLFYNSPVRRKNINVALEMDRIKYRICCLALMWPKVIISLRDDSTGQMILQTKKCSSTVGVFTDLFRTMSSNDLVEFSAERDKYSLVGFVSRDSHSQKDLQFVYINKRLVLRSCIHKQMNRILSHSSMLRKKDSSSFVSEKAPTQTTDKGSPSKQADSYGIFLLNISCPFNSYDITFDPRKTLVEFRDYSKLITFIQDTLYNLLRKENLLASEDFFYQKMIQKRGIDTEDILQNDFTANVPKVDEDRGNAYGANISVTNISNFLFSKSVKRFNENGSGIVVDNEPEVLQSQESPMCGNEDTTDVSEPEITSCQASTLGSESNRLEAETSHDEEMISNVVARSINTNPLSAFRNSDEATMNREEAIVTFPLIRVRTAAYKELSGNGPFGTTTSPCSNEEPFVGPGTSSSTALENPIDYGHKPEVPQQITLGKSVEYSSTLKCLREVNPFKLNHFSKKLSEVSIHSLDALKKASRPILNCEDIYKTPDVCKRKRSCDNSDMNSFGHSREKLNKSISFSSNSEPSLASKINHDEPNEVNSFIIRAPEENYASDPILGDSSQSGNKNYGSVNVDPAEDQNDDDPSSINPCSRIPAAPQEDCVMVRRDENETKSFRKIEMRKPKGVPKLFHASNELSNFKYSKPAKSASKILNSGNVSAHTAMTTEIDTANVKKLPNLKYLENPQADDVRTTTRSNLPSAQSYHPDQIKGHHEPRQNHNHSPLVIVEKAGPSPSSSSSSSSPCDSYQNDTTQSLPSLRVRDQLKPSFCERPDGGTDAVCGDDHCLPRESIISSCQIVELSYGEKGDSPSSCSPNLSQGFSPPCGESVKSFESPDDDIGLSPLTGLEKLNSTEYSETSITTSSFSNEMKSKTVHDKGGDQNNVIDQEIHKSSQGCDKLMTANEAENSNSEALMELELSKDRFTSTFSQRKRKSSCDIEVSLYFSSPKKSLDDSKKSDPENGVHSVTEKNNRNRIINGNENEDSSMDGTTSARILSNLEPQDKGPASPFSESCPALAAMNSKISEPDSLPLLNDNDEQSVSTVSEQKVSEQCDAVEVETVQIAVNHQSHVNGNVGIEALSDKLVDMDEISKTKTMVDVDQLSNKVVEIEKLPEDAVDTDEISEKVVEGHTLSQELVEIEKFSEEMVEKDKLSKKVIEIEKLPEDAVDIDELSGKVVEGHKLSQDVIDIDKVSEELVERDKLSEKVKERDTFSMGIDQEGNQTVEEGVSIGFSLDGGHQSKSCSQEKSQYTGDQQDHKVTESIDCDGVDETGDYIIIAPQDTMSPGGIPCGEEEGVSKWRENLTSVPATSPQKTVSCVMIHWKNPVFSKYKSPSVPAQTCPPSGTGKACFNFINGLEFTNQMLANAKVLCQIDNKFIACTIDDATFSHDPLCRRQNLLVLFDQHAIHERIRLENLTRDANEAQENTAVKRLKHAGVNPPVVLPISRDDVRVMKAFQTEFHRIGIEFQLNESVREEPKLIVNTLPFCMTQREADGKERDKEYLLRNAKDLTHEHINHLKSTNGSCGRMPLAVHRVLCSQACRGAVKFGDPLETRECGRLVSQLSGCNLPFQCAHGRPSVVPLIDLTRLDQHCNRRERKPRLERISTKMISNLH